MAFKFKLGDIVIPHTRFPQLDLPAKPARVKAIQLRGFIRIEFLDENKTLLVADKDYELWNQAQN